MRPRGAPGANRPASGPPHLDKAWLLAWHTPCFVAVTPNVAQPLRDMAALAEEPARGLPSLTPLEALFGALGTAAEPDAAARELIALLEAEPVLREGALVYVGRLCRSVRSWAALADLSLLPAHGLLAEMQDRLTAKILPSHRPPHDLIEVLDEVGQGRGASLWAERTSDDALIALCRALLPEDEASRQTLVHGSLRAIELLSHRLAATGEEPHLALFAEGGGDHESPFLAQAHEVVRFTAARREQRDDADPAHAFVLLRQCEDETARIERRIPQSGATIRLTYELERMSDLIARLRLLLTTLSPDPEVAWPARITLLRQLLRARIESQRVLPVVRRGLHLVAAEIVSHAGRAGGSYITRTRGEYMRMWRAAAGAGALVALAAVFKVGLGAWKAPLVIEAFLFSLNYAACFVAVQMLGFTIATKQPAMTAAALSENVDGQRDDHTRLVETIVCLSRSQLAAILGNVLVAFPAAFLASWGLAHLLGAPVADAAKAAHLVHDLHPLESGAIPHAALTGVWLSLAGIVAGYVSNSVIARHVPTRIARSRPLGRWLGEARRARLAELTASRAGATTGSVVLGVLLGSTGMVGLALGLPLEIRHVSFASANLGLAMHSLGPSGVALAWSVAGIASIGVTNLVVSFFLSLVLAMRARGQGFRELPSLAGHLARAFFRDFPGWFLPVGRTARASEPPPARPSLPGMRRPA